VGLQSRYGGWQICDYAHATAGQGPVIGKKNPAAIASCSTMTLLNTMKNRENAPLMNLYCK